MRIVIRQAGIADVELVAARFNEYRIFYGQPSDVEGAKLFLQELTANRHSVIFIAVDEESEGAIAGFTQLYPLYSSISMQRLLLLNDLFVAEEYRRQGVAERLIDAAKQYAIATNAKGLELSTAIDNAGAQRLYERTGFVRDEEFYYYFWSAEE